MAAIGDIAVEAPARLPQAMLAPRNGGTYFSSGFKIFTSSAWTNSLPQIRLPVLSGSSSPAMPLTMPPASREAAGGDEGHVERGGAKPSKPRDLVLDFGHFQPRQIMVAAADMRQATADHAFIELAAAGDAQPLVVEKRALAALGDVEFFIRGVVDHAGDDGAFALQADRDRKLRNAVQEIRGAVERIDDPGVALVVAFADAAFLADKAVARPGLGEVGVQHLLGAVIGHGDEIGRSLQRHLEILDLAKVARAECSMISAQDDLSVRSGLGLAGFFPVGALRLRGRQAGSFVAEPNARGLLGLGAILRT